MNWRDVVARAWLGFLAVLWAVATVAGVVAMFWDDETRPVMFMVMACGAVYVVGRLLIQFTLWAWERTFPTPEDGQMEALA